MAGLDLNQIESRIIQALGNKVQEPEVIVEFDAPRTHTVMVSGDVKNPGRVSMLEDVRTVVDAINKAGGPLASAAGSGANQTPGRGASQWSGHTDDAILRFVGRQ